jgi:hypothetical protein
VKSANGAAFVNVEDRPDESKVGALAGSYFITENVAGWWLESVSVIIQAV